MVTLYNVISLDGFIARPDGGENFISDNLWGEFVELCKKYDAVVIGRKTYEAVQKYDKESREMFETINTLRVIVSSDKNFIHQPNL